MGPKNRNPLLTSRLVSPAAKLVDDSVPPPPVLILTSPNCNWIVDFVQLCKGINPLFLPTPWPCRLPHRWGRWQGVVEVAVVAPSGINVSTPGLIVHLSCSLFPSSAACQGLWPYHPPHWFRKNPFRPLWREKLLSICRTQQQTISSLTLTAKRHNQLGVIPVERPSGLNCQVCSNHRRGPCGCLTKLSLKTLGPSQRGPGLSQHLHSVPIQVTVMFCANLWHFVSPLWVCEGPTIAPPHSCKTLSQCNHPRTGTQHHMHYGC